RRRGLGHVDGAGRLVEILAELAGPAVADQRIERRVIGQGAAGKPTQRDRAGALREKAAPIDAVAAAVAGLFHGAMSWSCPLAGRFSMPPTGRQRVPHAVRAAPFSGYGSPPANLWPQTTERMAAL